VPVFSGVSDAWIPNLLARTQAFDGLNRSTSSVQRGGGYPCTGIILLEWKRPLVLVAIKR